MASSVVDNVVLPHPNKVTYVPGTDFNRYMKQLREANEGNMELYRSFKMYAFTRMTGGLVLDFVPDGMDLFHAMYVTRQRNYSLAGLSERMAQYIFREELTYLSPMFFDMDLETDQDVSLDMVEELIRDVLFPCARKFFNLDGSASAPALHFAVYSPLEDSADEPVLQPSVKHTLVCGCCRKHALKMTMAGSVPVAECFQCALRFPRSIETNDVGRYPIMFSKAQLLRKYNACHARRHRFIRPPEPWTSLDDPEVEWERGMHTIGFKVNLQPIEVTVGAFRNHVRKTKRKYSIHIKAMQTSHAQVEAMKRHNAVVARRFRAFQTKFRHLPGDKKNIRAFVQYEQRKRAYHNKEQRRYEAQRVTRAYAEKQTAHYFGFPIHKMHAQDKQLCEHLLDEKTLANVIMTQEIFLNFMAYLVSQATKYQSNLRDMHPFKHIDVSEMFDPSPAINGAALRLCFDRLNEPKPIKCRCENIPKEKRKRNANGYIVASSECDDCHGKGHYMDTSRNPTRLARILVDPSHARHDTLQQKMDDLLPRLHLPHNLPVLLAVTSTRVSLSGLTSVGTHDNTTNGVYADITPSIERCMRNVPPDIIYKKKSTQPSGPRITDGHILEVVQKYIRSTDVVQWRELSVQALVPWNDDKFPRYRVNVHATSSGAHFCPYKNDEHRSNTVYFVLIPPNNNGSLARMFASCWSATCEGHWRKTCQRDKKSWVLTKQDAALIWPGLARMRMLDGPNLADAAGSIQAIYEDSTLGSESDLPSQTMSFREVLQSKKKHRAIVSAFEYFRLKRDESDPQPVLAEAYRSLNLMGI